MQRIIRIKGEQTARIANEDRVLWQLHDGEEIRPIAEQASIGGAEFTFRTPKGPAWICLTRNEYDSWTEDE